jgi:hypothetical protein
MMPKKIKRLTANSASTSASSSRNRRRQHVRFRFLEELLAETLGAEKYCEQAISAAVL